MVFCLIAAGRLPKWRAMRRELTETNTFSGRSRFHPSRRTWFSAGGRGSTRAAGHGFQREGEVPSEPQDMVFSGRARFHPSRETWFSAGGRGSTRAARPGFQREGEVPSRAAGHGFQREGEVPSRAARPGLRLGRSRALPDGHNTGWQRSVSPRRAMRKNAGRTFRRSETRQYLRPVHSVGCSSSRLVAGEIREVPGLFLLPNAASQVVSVRWPGRHWTVRSAESSTTMFPGSGPAMYRDFDW